MTTTNTLHSIKCLHLAILTAQTSATACNFYLLISRTSERRFAVNRTSRRATAVPTLSDTMRALTTPPDDELPMMSSVRPPSAAPRDVSEAERASLLDRPVNTNRDVQRGCYVAALVTGALALGSVAVIARHGSPSVDSVGLGAARWSKSGEYAALLGGALKWEDVFGNMSVEGRKELVLRDVGNRTEGQGLPTFLHVPKNGGTTIETALGVLGIDVGYCHVPSVQGAPRLYELRPRFHGFELWHTPPANAVPDSWGIVRNPYHRVGSEFLWDTHIFNRALFDSLKPGYSAKNCEVLQDYVQDRISGMIDNPARKCYDAAGYTMEGMAMCDANATVGEGIGATSHWIPQSIMLASADKVFRYETCFDDEDGQCDDARTGDQIDNIILFLRKRYHPAVTIKESTVQWPADVEKPDFASCWKDFDPALLNVFNDLYKHDIKRFGYTFIQPNPDASGSSFSHHHQAHRKTLGEIAIELGRDLQQYNGPSCF